MHIMKILWLRRGGGRREEGQRVGGREVMFKGKIFQKDVYN